MKETLTLTISKVFYHNYNTILSISPWKKKT